MRSSFVTIGACVLLFGVTSAYSEEAKNGNTVDRIVWGEVVNGLQLGISPPVKLGETHEFAGFDGPITCSGHIVPSVEALLANLRRSPPPPHFATDAGPVDRRSWISRADQYSLRG